jgi:hypothetical protein
MSIKKFFSKRDLRDIKASDSYVHSFMNEDDDESDSFFWREHWSFCKDEDTGGDLYLRYMFPNSMEDLTISKFIIVLQKLGIREAKLEDSHFI